MKRLHFLVEGPTEREFVRDVLSPHLFGYDVVCDARLISMSRDWSSGRFYKGGISSYGKIRHEVELAIKEDDSPDSFFTTMFDYYGLPKDFPGMGEVNDTKSHKRHIEDVERAFLGDIISSLPQLQIEKKFLPNIVCHEFESLIFSDLSALLNYYPDRESEIKSLQRQLEDAECDPEAINTSVASAPSKRILALIPEYDKVTAGALTTLDIGLKTIRNRCLHFNDWLTKLESI